MKVTIKEILNEICFNCGLCNHKYNCRTIEDAKHALHTLIKKKRAEEKLKKQNDDNMQMLQELTEVQQSALRCSAWESIMSELPEEEEAELEKENFSRLKKGFPPEVSLTPEHEEKIRQLKELEETAEKNYQNATGTLDYMDATGTRLKSIGGQG
jgi:hypothetical protein